MRVIACLVVVALSVTVAGAEPRSIDKPTEIVHGATCTTKKGTVFDMVPRTVCTAPGHWEASDKEMRRLQDAETRLTAENKSLRKSLRAQPARWHIVTTVFLLGVAAGGAWAKWR